MDYQSEDHGMQDRGTIGETISASGLIHKNDLLIIRDTLVRIIIFYILSFYYTYTNCLCLKYTFNISDNIGTGNIVILFLLLTYSFKCISCLLLAVYWDIS